MGNSCGLPSRSRSGLDDQDRRPKPSDRVSETASEKTCVESLADLSIKERDADYKVVPSEVKCRGCGLHCPPHSCATPTSNSTVIGTVKLPTDVVGIMREGQLSTTTAMIQLLYHARPFRDAVSDIVRKNSDPYGLQAGAAICLDRVFRDLSEKKLPVALGDLTPLLGYDDRFERQRYGGTYEMLALIAAVSWKRDSGLNGLIDDLFGVKKNLTSRWYHPTELSSNRDEQSIGMRVDVQGLPSFDAAMTQFLQPTALHEVMVRMDIEMQTTIETIPDIWITDLKRFYEHGIIEGTTICRNRFEFEEQIDVRKFLTNTDSGRKGSGKDDDSMYCLCGVLVFERLGWEGKWWLYLRLQNKDCGEKQTGDDGWTWWKFDGPMVCEVDKSEVIEGNFGPGLPDIKVSWAEFEHQRGYWEYPRTADALIYVKQSKVDQIFGQRQAAMERKI